MSGARTEEPTARRIRRAREDGDTGASAFASQAIALVVAVALLPATVAAAAARIEERLRDAIHRAAAQGEIPLPTIDVAGVAKDVMLLSLPVVAGVALAVAASSVIQAGGFAVARRVGLGPLAGLGSLVSRARLYAVARALAGGALVAWVALRALRVHAPDIVRTSGRLALAGPAAARMAESVAWEVALVGLAIGAVDIVVARALWRGRLRMSRDEIRREQKEAEGDPLAKGARELAREEMAARGAAADVRLARVVVRDGSRAACALKFEEGDRAPVVLATGEGEAADQIVRTARAHGVPVEDAGSIARALAELRAGEAIPEALYDDVAELLRGLAQNKNQ